MDREGAAPFYSIEDLGTELYDLVTELHIAGSSVEGDTDFYRATASRTGGPVLDVGCGTGRVSAALAADGLEVVGLDLSAPMLKLAARRRAELPADVAARLTFVQDDMTDFQLGRLFALIVVPFRVFQFLLTPESQRSALAALRRHLGPGGLIVLDLFDPRLDLCVPGVEERFRPVATLLHPITGNEVRIEILEKVNHPLDQTFSELWQTSEVDVSGAAIRSIQESLTLRWTYRFEMRHLLELTGFEVVAEHGDFKGSPPAYGREQVWVVRAAGSNIGSLPR